MSLQLLGLVWLVGCESADQYLLIERALVDASVDPYGGVGDPSVPAPTFVVVEGDSALTGDSSVTFQVTFSIDATMEVNALMIAATYPRDLDELWAPWILELDPAELEAGMAEVTIASSSDKPDAEECKKDWRGMYTTCYQPAETGTTGVMVAATDGTERTDYTPLPVTLAPIVDAGDDCAIYTYEECCACTWDPNLNTNICPLECYVPPACGCAAGTAYRGDFEGFNACECPG